MRDEMGKNLKNVVFSKFYLELVIFFIILFISTTINMCFYEMINQKNILIVSSLILMVITLLSLYSFGFIIAQKRALLNKYFPSIFFLVIFVIIWILSSIFCKENNIFAQYLNDIDKMIVLMHKYIFNSINMIFSINIPDRLLIFITPFMVYLGNRKSRMKQLAIDKRQKRNGKEEINECTNN